MVQWIRRKQFWRFYANETLDALAHFLPKCQSRFIYSKILCTFPDCKSLFLQSQNMCRVTSRFIDTEFRPGKRRSENCRRSTCIKTKEKCTSDTLTFLDGFSSGCQVIDSKIRQPHHQDVEQVRFLTGTFPITLQLFKVRCPITSLRMVEVLEQGYDYNTYYIKVLSTNVPSQF